MRRPFLLLLAGTVLVTGCSTDQRQVDDLQVADSVSAATPASSPATAQPAAGTVHPLSGKVTALLADPVSRTLAVAVTDPAALLLYPLDDLSAAPRTVPLPGAVSQLSLDGAQLLAPVRAASQLVTVALPGGSVSQTAVPGGPDSVSVAAGRTLVTLADRRAIAVLDGDRVVREITGQVTPGQVLSTGDKAVVLDRIRTAVFDLDPAGDLGAGLRAGDGATNAVTDRYGRVLVADTRGGQLLAFSTGPILMRQRFPVPGAPYGIAYDGTRDLVWLTLTERNEVVGYDVAGGEPVERYRFATIRQPNTVTVDPRSGRVIVASGAGGGVQVMQP